MRAYAIRRILLIFPTIILLTMIVFLSVRFIPRDVIDMTVAEINTEGVMTYEKARDMLRGQLGLDTPIHVQYWKWVSGVLRGDLGTSMRTDNSITVIGRSRKHTGVSIYHSSRDSDSAF